MVGWVGVSGCMLLRASEDIDLVIEQMDTLLGTYSDNNVVLAGDFNAKSTI